MSQALRRGKRVEFPFGRLQRIRHRKGQWRGRYPRKWNHEFVDMPIVEPAKQNTPCFSPEVMSGLAG